MARSWCGCARPVLRSKIDIDGQVSAHQPLGLGMPVGGVKQRGEVVKVGRDVRMVRPKALLEDCQRPAHQRLRLGQSVGGLQQSG
jgi:hypothetical protein